jgi:hypothetical protein
MLRPRAMARNSKPESTKGAVMAMTKSTAKGVKSLPKSAFAYPSKRAYPINTPKRAKAALSRAGQSKTSGTYAHVARAVRKRYGNRIASVGKARGTVTRAGYRKR